MSTASALTSKATTSRARRASDGVIVPVPQPKSRTRLPARGPAWCSSSARVVDSNRAIRLCGPLPWSVLHLSPPRVARNRPSASLKSVEYVRSNSWLAAYAGASGRGYGRGSRAAEIWEPFVRCRPVDGRWVQRARPMLRRVGMYFSRSSHRELLTRSLRPHIEAMAGLVVDVGGGRDSPLAMFWPDRARRVRVDISPRFAPDVAGDAQALPLRTGSVNGVVISEVLEHVPNPKQAISEIHRVLRPGGGLVGSVPFGIGVHADPHDYFRYTREALEMMLAGFVEVDVRAHGNHIGVAWRAINDRWHWLWVMNPLVRPFVRRTNERWPVGYTFTSRKPETTASRPIT